MQKKERVKRFMCLPACIGVSSLFAKRAAVKAVEDKWCSGEEGAVANAQEVPISRGCSDMVVLSIISSDDNNGS